LSSEQNSSPGATGTVAATNAATNLPSSIDTSGHVLGASTSAVDPVTHSELDAALNGLRTQFWSALSFSGPAASTPISTASFAPSQRIDQLNNTTLNNITVSGVAGLTDADIPDGITASNYLPLSGGTVTGDLTVSGSISSPSLSLGQLGGDVVVGDVGSPSNLVFQENSIIKGAGSGRNLTFGANSDILTFAVISNFTAGASSTQLSIFNKAYFGATATSSFDSAGALSLSTPLLVSSGGTGWASLSSGYIPFGNGSSAIATSSNLFWDSTNSRLGIGTTSPYSLLSISNSASTLANTPLFSIASTTGGTSTRTVLIEGASAPSMVPDYPATTTLPANSLATTTSS
jgi:hypothetical protein